MGQDERLPQECWQAIVEKFLRSSSVCTIEVLAPVAPNEEHAEKQVPRCYECWPLTPNVLEKSLEQSSKFGIHRSQELPLGVQLRYTGS